VLYEPAQVGIDMNSSLSKIARRSKALIIAYKIFINWRMRRRFASGEIQTTHGSTHKAKTIAESLRYIQDQFEDYLSYSGLAAENLCGKRVLELGFGDNVGVALKFLAKGAAQVICLDKFYSERDLNHQGKIYKALRGTLREEERLRFDQAIRLDPIFEINPSRLKCVYGVALETVTDSLANEGQFDLIISRAVIEEIYEPDVLFSGMDSLLAPGGYMLHKIDLSDYGMFRDGGMNPLTFLTITEPVYRLMASDSGLPNRRLIGYYRRQMEDLGYDAKLLVTDLIGREGKGDLHPHKDRLERGVDYGQSTLEYVEAIRPRLDAGFRHLPAEELIVAGLFLVARKPVGTSVISVPQG
jgi:hypothetical protein